MSGPMEDFSGYNAVADNLRLMINVVQEEVEGNDPLG